MSKKTKKQDAFIIRASGWGFVVVLFIYLTFIISAVVLSICFFVPNTDTGMYGNWVYLIVFVGGTIYISYDFVEFLKARRVFFYEDTFEYISSKCTIFSKIKCKYAKFKDYKFVSGICGKCIEFEFTNGKKEILHIMQFSKKQKYQIIEEIKKRGGFAGLDDSKANQNEDNKNN